MRLHTRRQFYDMLALRVSSLCHALHSALFARYDNMNTRRRVAMSFLPLLFDVMP